MPPAELRRVAANLMRAVFGEETGALKDWPNLVDPDTARAVPLVADKLIILVLTNIGATAHLADYLGEALNAGELPRLDPEGIMGVLGVKALPV